MILRKNKKIYKVFLSATTFLLLVSTAGTMHAGLHWPLKYPKRITGTFGEYRGIKFHRGLDMSCGGRQGVPVLAAESGYVKTVMYQKWGIGYCLFLQHPDGRVTMYGHLSRFSSKISRHGSLKKIQGKMLDRVDFRTDFNSPAIPVRRGEVIAYTGDTGIGREHLHFEVKNGNNRFLNPLRQGLSIPDKTRPVVQRVYLLPLDGRSLVDGESREKSLQVIRGKGNGGNYYLRGGEIPRVAGTVGIKIKASDRVNYRNRVSVYGFDVRLNGKTLYRKFFDDMSRSETYHLGLYFDYDRSSYSNYIYYGYDRRSNLGALKGLKPGKIYKITAYFYDAAGNRSRLFFRVRGDEPLKRAAWKRLINLRPGRKLDLESRDKRFALLFDKGSGLYDEEVIIRMEPAFNIDEPGLTMKSSVYAVFPTDLALDRPVRVRFKYRGDDFRKVGIYAVNGSKGFFYFAGDMRNGSDTIETEVRKMGRYFLVRDDVPPHIGKNNVKMVRGRRLIYFYLADIGSGVDLERIQLKVDGRDVKWDFDPDRGRLEILRHNKIWKRGKHIISLRIFDRAGNKTAVENYSYIIR